MTSNSQLDVSPSDAPVPEAETGGQMTFFEHLVELRKRIINAGIAVFLGAMAGWFLAPKFVNIITVPVRNALTAHGIKAELYYTGPTDYLSLLIKLSIYMGIVMASPVILYQVWLFVAPALYRNEKSAVTSFFVFTVVLFVGGIRFGYFLGFSHFLDFFLVFLWTVEPVDQ